jgi:hypothetical protein
MELTDGKKILRDFCFPALAPTYISFHYLQVKSLNSYQIIVAIFTVFTVPHIVWPCSQTWMLALA